MLSSPRGDPHIKNDEKEDPHHVDEVPVQGHRRWTDVVARIELSARRAIEDEGQKDESAQHVCAVEAGHREKGAGERVRGQVQAAMEGVDELVQLAELECESKDDGRDLEHEESAPVVVRKAIQGEVTGHTTRKEQHRVDGGNAQPADVVLG